MFVSAIALALAAQAQAPALPPVARLEATEVRRHIAPEARQGVAVDARHFYAVVNSRIGKYEKDTGKKVAEWIGDHHRITHLNSCAVIEAQLVCANSNFPQVPMASSVEIFDPKTMRHVRSIPLGMRLGSLTWLDRKDGHGGRALPITTIRAASPAATIASRWSSASTTSGG